MATEARPLFDFYFRYKWDEVDFADWQDTMIGTLRDTIGSIFGPALIAGGSVAPSGATRAVTVAAYETVNSDGYTCVRNSTVLAPVSANASGNPRKDLIVARPLLTNQSTITRPTSPFDTVPFHVGQDTEIVVIAGTPAGSPAYPAKAAGDVVIAGLAVANGATSFSSGNIDTTVTELLSGNTNFSNWVVKRDVHGCSSVQSSGANTDGNDAAFRVFTLVSGQAALEGVSLDKAGGSFSVATSGDGALGVGGSNSASNGVRGVGSNGSGVRGESANISTRGSVEAVNSSGGIACLIDNGGGGSPGRGAVRVNPSGAPTGASLVGDMYVTTAGVLKICTVAGTPGTWVSVGTQT